jgi:hypothetical protein
MGSCGTSSKNTGTIKNQQQQQFNGNMNNNQPINQVNNNNGNMNGVKGNNLNNYQAYGSMNQNQNEEAYYQEVALSSNFGTDFGPKEKIQFNVGVRGGDFNSTYLVSISMSYDKSGSNAILLGATKEEPCVSQDGSLNFSLSFILDYFFEKQQYLFITVRKNGQNTVIQSSVGRVMGSRGQSTLIPFYENSKENVILSANTIKNNNVMICVSFSLTTDKPNPNTDFWKIQKSELKPVGNGPVQYNPNRIPAMFLCNGDYDFPISIEFHSVSDKTILGIHNTTVTRLLSERSFTVGTLQVNCNSELAKEHTFIDFLRGGTQLSLTLGLDFTGSNGNPKDKDSLHAISTNGKPNQYQLATRSCGDILAYYDYDQTFPVYGYGAILPNTTNDVNHCFPLTLNQDPNIHLIDGVLEQYRNVMPHLSFSGPTYFAPLINQCLYNIKNGGNPAVYHILLILTDGMINDMNETIAALVEGSFLPMSVIIVGVGTGDFGNMDLLDADGKRLTDHRGKQAGRDLVQFVPFYKFANDGTKLAEQVLAEVPRQLVDYYRMIKQPPGDPIVNI